MKKIGKRKVYWDTAVFLAWLMNEHHWPAAVIVGIQDVVFEVENEVAVLFTSTVTRTEIFMGKLSDNQKLRYTQLMRRTNVTEIAADMRITDRASVIREYYNAKGIKIKTPDAIHLATAILYKADELQTMDGLERGGANLTKLLGLDGNVAGSPLRVVHPYPRGNPPGVATASIDGPLFEKEKTNAKQIKK